MQNAQKAVLMQYFFNSQIVTYWPFTVRVVRGFQQQDAPILR